MIVIKMMGESKKKKQTTKKQNHLRIYARMKGELFPRVCCVVSCRVVSCRVVSCPVVSCRFTMHANLSLSPPLPFFFFFIFLVDVSKKIKKKIVR